jgi:transposase
MLYDTKIIKNDTYDNLLNLTYEYPISRTNEQGIIALYFTNIQPLFKQIKLHNESIYFYDFLSRNNNNKYIMLKLI